MGVGEGRAQARSPGRAGHANLGTTAARGLSGPELPQGPQERAVRGSLGCAAVSVSPPMSPPLRSFCGRAISSPCTAGCTTPPVASDFLPCFENSRPQPCTFFLPMPRAVVWSSSSSYSGQCLVNGLAVSWSESTRSSQIWLVVKVAC